MGDYSVSLVLLGVRVGIGAVQKVLALVNVGIPLPRIDDFTVELCRIPELCHVSETCVSIIANLLVTISLRDDLSLLLSFQGLLNDPLLHLSLVFLVVLLVVVEHLDPRVLTLAGACLRVPGFTTGICTLIIIPLVFPALSRHYSVRVDRPIHV